MLQRLKAGEGQVLGELFDKYSTDLLQLAKDKKASSEIVANAFIALWSDKDNLKTETEIKDYLYLFVDKYSVMYEKV